MSWEPELKGEKIVVGVVWAWEDALGERQAQISSTVVDCQCFISVALWS